MSTSTVEYRIEAVSISKDLAKALSDARTAVSSAEKALIDAYRGSPRYQALADLAGYGASGYGKSTAVLRVVGSQIVGNVMIDVPAKASSPQLYADPKTVNLLLSGKLLTDAEKRKLIKRIGIDFDEAGDA